jgi:hypothetical protein
MAPPKMEVWRHQNPHRAVVERGDMEMRIKVEMEMEIKMEIKFEERKSKESSTKAQVDVHRVLLLSHK